MKCRELVVEQQEESPGGLDTIEEERGTGLVGAEDGKYHGHSGCLEIN